MAIHKLAQVDSAAEIHDSVEVGPYSIIEGNVSIGEGTQISSHVRIESGTRIGAFNKIFHGCVLGVRPQHLAYDPATMETELFIGDHNELREYVNIHRAYNVETPTRIGDSNYFMGNVHIGHDCEIENNNIITHSSILAGHVIVGSRVFISGLVGIHQFCRVGNFAIIGGMSKITQDVPPFSMVDGNPAVVTGLNTIGMRRGDISKERLRAIKEAYKVLYRSKKTVKSALEYLTENNPGEDVQYLIDFHEKSDRGVIDYGRVEEDVNF